MALTINISKKTVNSTYSVTAQDTVPINGTHFYININGFKNKEEQNIYYKELKKVVDRLND